MVHLVKRQLVQYQQHKVKDAQPTQVVQSCTGGTFSFAQSFTQGDAYGTGADHTKYGNVSITDGATIGSGSPGTVTNAHTITIDQGGSSNGSIGAGSALTGQFVSEISVF